MSTQDHLQPASRKRKASTDLPPDLTRRTEDNATQASTNSHMLQTSIKEISSMYEQTYSDTIAEIKRLLQYYASVLTADANPDLDGEVNSTATAELVAVQNNKTELKAILDDLASKPELVGLEDVRKVLMDCGIMVDVREGQHGEKIVDVKLL